MYFILLICSLFVSSLSPISPQYENTQTEAIVIISDIHGDIHTLIEALWQAFVEVEPGALRTSPSRPAVTRDDFFGTLLYISGDISQVPLFPMGLRRDRIVLVQLGDVADRGSNTIGCFNILHSLHLTIGWSLEALYGNHEIAHLTGSAIGSGFVSTADMESYGGKRSYHELFDPRSGDLFRSIVATSKLVYSFGDVLFVHAGLPLDWASAVGRSIDWVNGVTREMILNQSTENLDADSSPVNTRLFDFIQGLPLEGQMEVCSRTVFPVLDTLGFRLMVVGHVPQEDRQVKTVCGGRVLMTDVVMSRYFYPDGADQGQPAAVIMEVSHGDVDERVIVRYKDRRVILPTAGRYGKEVALGEYFPPLSREWRSDNSRKEASAEMRDTLID
jgi:hypothetical protein